MNPQAQIVDGIRQPAIADPSETIRRVLQLKINAESAERADLESRHGRVWSSSELRADFTVLEFHAPVVVVQRKSDSKLGSLFFQHFPRFYFDFKEDE